MAEGSRDRRGFIRIPFKTEVKIEADSTVFWSDEEINVSMSGVRLSFKGPIPKPGSACRVSILLKAFENRISIDAGGKIVRSEPGSLAVEFSELDLDSYNHLRQLILNNTEDPERAEQEFINHWGIKRPSL
jgi:hypothetical protein